MLMVLSKSAAALMVGGAFVGQQADIPSPSVPTPDISRSSTAIQGQASGAQATDVQAQQNVGQRTIDQQQSLQNRTNIDAQTRTNVDAQGRTHLDAQGRTNVEAQGRTDLRSLNQRQTFQAQDRAGAQVQGQQNLQLDQQSQQQADQQGRAALGVSVSDDLTIRQVSPGSPAQRMGLRAGDEILSVNGQAFDSTDGFVQAIGATPHGQQVQIEFDRNGQRMTHTGVLATWDQVHSGTGGTQYGAGYSQGIQNYSAMRYPSDGVAQTVPLDGQQFTSDACCCAGGFSDGGFGYGGYGYGWDNGWSRRSARRAARWGSNW